MKVLRSTLAPSHVSTFREDVGHEVRLARRDGSEAATVDRGKHRRAVSAESENLACADTPCAGIGRLWGGVWMGFEETFLDATGKGKPRTPVVRSLEESDGNIVPERSASKGVATSAESVEGRKPHTGRRAGNVRRLDSSECVREPRRTKRFRSITCSIS